jgi:hypothetical protein
MPGSFSGNSSPAQSPHSLNWIFCAATVPRRDLAMATVTFFF